MSIHQVNNRRRKGAGPTAWTAWTAWTANPTTAGRQDGGTVGRDGVHAPAGLGPPPAP
jgi:hypothetical protein